MKTRELRELTDDEIKAKHLVFKKELFELNYKRKMGTIEKNASFGNIKKNIARLQTILREREIIDERKSKQN